MAKKKLIELRHPFFAPLWRRVLTVAVIAAWVLVELSSGNIGWAIASGALAAFCAYEFFVIFDPANYKEQDND